MRCLDSALSLDGTLDAPDIRIRKLFLSLNVAVFVGALLVASAQLASLRMKYLYWVAVFVLVSSTLSAVLMILCKCKLTTNRILVLCCVYGVTLLSIDLSARSEYTHRWPVMVLMVDFLLVMQVPTRYSTAVVVCTLVYLAVTAAEEVFRFGLLDMPGLVSQADRREYVDSLGDCAALPCKQKKALSNFALAASVFVVDFIATQGFARGLLKEQAQMQRTVATVQVIASLLAGYDVEQVAELLEEHSSELPEGVTVALRQLEQNLRKYKAYLPKTCLPFGEDIERYSSSSESSAPSVPASSRSVVSRLLCDACIQPLGLSAVKATLLTVNIKDTLRHLEEDSARFSQLFTTILLRILKATESRCGMVDVFVGDRIHCSFNASKQCASHATSALHAARLLTQNGTQAGTYDMENMNLGVATGKVLRGDMGCEVMRRFSMVGTLVRDVYGIERSGRVLGCDVLCNRLCFSDAQCEHDLRLLPCKVEVAPDCEPEVVAELVSREDDTVCAAQEWMYKIGRKKHWEEYNTVVRGYLRGERCYKDVAKAWEEAGGGGGGTPAHAVPYGTRSVVRSYLRWFIDCEPPVRR